MKCPKYVSTGNSSFCFVIFKIDGACSHAPECLSISTKRHTHSISFSASSSRDLAVLLDLIESQFLSFMVPVPVGGISTVHDSSTNLAEQCQ